MLRTAWKYLTTFNKNSFIFFVNDRNSLTAAFLSKSYKKTQKEEFVQFRSTLWYPTCESCRCQGWEVEGPGRVGGSDETLLAVNELWTDTLISACNLHGANRWIFPLTREITQSLRRDNRDLPFNVSSIETGDKQRVDQNREAEC